MDTVLQPYTTLYNIIDQYDYNRYNGTLHHIYYIIYEIKKKRLKIMKQSDNRSIAVVVEESELNSLNSHLEKVEQLTVCKFPP